MTKLDLNLGAQVYCKDRACGKLVKLVIEPRAPQVTALVVEKGLLLKSDHVIPLVLVERATEHEILLNLQSDALSHYAEYQVVEVTEPASDAEQDEFMAETAPARVAKPAAASPTTRKRVRQGIAAGETVIGANTKVENLHKTLGQVARVVLDQQSGQLINVVMRQGFLAEYRAIPAEQIKEIHEEALFIALTSAEVAALPRDIPQADTEVFAELAERLALDERLPPTAFPVFADVNATAVGGVLQLTGCVPSKALQYHAATGITSQQAGVDVVINELVITPGT